MKDKGVGECLSLGFQLAVMAELQRTVLLLLVCLGVSCVSDDVGQCPTWRWFNRSSGMCECGSEVWGTIKCSEENGSVYARFDVCVSWDSHSETVLTSLCKYKRSRSPVTDRVFTELPQSPHNLSYDECELNNREGMFCGRCKEGFAPSLHIFRGMCTNCSNCLQNPPSLFLFLALELLPLTVFYLLVMALHINIVSGPMLGYAIFCQVHINLLHIHPNIFNFLLSHSGKWLMTWNMYVLLPLAGIWNLNFFAMFTRDLCYGCGFNNLSGILMEYLSVLYIFILVALSFYLSRLNVKTKLASVRFCKMIIYSLIRWRKNLSVSDSALHSLATFTALLVAKVGTISLQLTANKQVHNVNGTVVKYVLSFEPSIEAFSQQHTPYAIAAYVSLFFFVLIPLLVLCLYPSRHFQNLLMHCCGPRQRLSLAIFVDTICSGYRDGLDGGRDWRRLFPLSFISLALAILVIVECFRTLSESYFILMLPAFMLFPFFIMYFKPYKTKQMNASLSFHMAIMAFSILTLALWMQDYFLDARILEILLTFWLTLPHVVMLLWLLSNIVQRFQSLRNCFQKTKQLSFGRAQFLLYRFE